MRIFGVRRLLLATAVATVVLPAAAPADAAAARCAGARETVAAGSVPEARKAVLCLLNRIRRDRDLRRLRADRRLRLAAERHSSDMAARRYFSHESPGGGTLLTRVLRVGYVRPDVIWSVAENIGWGSGELGTPKSMVRAWMRSPGHRANIVSARYREIGIGIALGTPEGGSGAIYTTDFGSRR